MPEYRIGDRDRPLSKTGINLEIVDGATSPTTKGLQPASIAIASYNLKRGNRDRNELALYLQKYQKSRVPLAGFNHTNVINFSSQFGKGFPQNWQSNRTHQSILSRKSLYSRSAVSFGDWCAWETATQQSTYKYSIKSNKQQTTSTRVP